MDDEVQGVELWIMPICRAGRSRLTPSRYRKLRQALHPGLEPCLLLLSWWLMVTVWMCARLSSSLPFSSIPASVHLGWPCLCLAHRPARLEDVGQTRAWESGAD